MLFRVSFVFVSIVTFILIGASCQGAYTTGPSMLSEEYGIAALYRQRDRERNTLEQFSPALTRTAPHQKRVWLSYQEEVTATLVRQFFIPLGKLSYYGTESYENYRGLFSARNEDDVWSWAGDKLELFLMAALRGARIAAICNPDFRSILNPLHIATPVNSTVLAVPSLLRNYQSKCIMALLRLLTLRVATPVAYYDFIHHKLTKVLHVPQLSSIVLQYLPFVDVSTYASDVLHNYLKAQVTQKDCRKDFLYLAKDRCISYSGAIPRMLLKFRRHKKRILHDHFSLPLQTVQAALEINHPLSALQKDFLIQLLLAWYYTVLIAYSAKPPS